jgi:hypothetical protein
MPIVGAYNWRDGEISARYSGYLRSRPSRRDSGSVEQPTRRAARRSGATALRELHREFVYRKEGRDAWSLPDRARDGKYYNDCDGYAALAKERLLDAGFGERWLRLALCSTVPDLPWSLRDLRFNHMVLIVNCRDGDLVADNLHPRRMEDWRSVSYEWRVREPAAPGDFELLGNPRA